MTEFSPIKSVSEAEDILHGAQVKIAELVEFYKSKESSELNRVRRSPFVEAIHRLETEPELFIAGYPELEFGGLPSAVKSANSMHKDDLPRSKELAIALYQRNRAQVYLRLKPIFEVKPT